MQPNAANHYIRAIISAVDPKQPFVVLRISSISSQKIESKTKYIGIGFAFGVLVGAAAGVSISGKETESGAAAVLRSGQSLRHESGPKNDAETSAILPASNGPSISASPVDPESITIEPSQADEVASPSGLNAQSRNPTPIPISEAHADFIFSQSITDPTDGETRPAREVLEAEEIDDSWSYFMKQSLQLFLSSHVEAIKFSIFHIECRTSMCEIQAVGFNDSTAPDWSRILYDMAQQPWYDFGQVGTSSNDYQGQLAILTRLYRNVAAQNFE